MRLASRIRHTQPLLRSLAPVLGRSQFISRGFGAMLSEEEDNDSKTKNVSRRAKTNNPPLVTFEDISLAHYRIREGIIKTPTRHSDSMSGALGMDIHFKEEINQLTGSFKERGARNAIMTVLKLDPVQAERGLIAASAGNHALAMAWHGKSLGIPITVVMPRTAPMAKVERCRRFGARVIIHGSHILEAKVEADSLAKSEQLKYINGFDDAEIIAGQGTVGIEIMEQCPDVDVIVVPVGGGGLIAGIALAVKTINPNVKIIGVEPEFAASWTAAVAEGKPVPCQIDHTLADGLAVPTVGARAFEVGNPLIDETVLVKEQEIYLAVLRLVELEKSIVEGAGATGLAALLPGGPLFNRPDLMDKKIVVPLCGGNIDSNILGRVIERGLVADNRLTSFSSEVSDLPGSIHRLTGVVADCGASVVDIHHERAWVASSVNRVRIQVTCEITGTEHLTRLKETLRSKGYTPVFRKS